MIEREGMMRLLKGAREVFPICIPSWKRWDRKDNKTMAKLIDESDDEIKEKIGDGYTMAVDDGMIAIFTDDPFIQFQPYEDETGVKVAYLSCILNAFV